MSTDFLDTLVANQAARQPAPMDMDPWMSRYVFVPFRDRDLSILQQGLLGLPAIRQGHIHPLTRFKQQIMDYDEVKRVPTNRDGSYQPAELGVSKMKLSEREPRKCLNALFAIFNPNVGTDPQHDNGILEIECMRGIDDVEVFKAIQLAAIGNNRYETASEQLAALDSALGESRRRNATLHVGAIETMIESTERSRTWARWHYHDLQAQMEDKARSGKDRLSPLDAAVCRWIEMAEPRFRSQLVGEVQPVAVQQAQPAVHPTIQHKRCGAFVNLVDGQPPELCYVCGAPFETIVTPEPEPKKK